MNSNTHTFVPEMRPFVEYYFTLFFFSSFSCLAFIKKAFPIMNIPREMNIAIPEYSSLNIVVLAKLTKNINTSDIYNPTIYFTNCPPFYC